MTEYWQEFMKQLRPLDSVSIHEMIQYIYAFCNAHPKYTIEMTELYLLTQIVNEQTRRNLVVDRTRNNKHTIH